MSGVTATGPTASDTGHPCGPGTRPDDRRGDHPDLPDLDVRPGRRRRTRSGLRVLPLRQPDPDRAREVPRRARGRTVGLAFASGLAAEDTLLRAVLQPGDHVVIPHDAYGGTFRLVDEVLGPWGVAHTPVDWRLTAVRTACAPRPG